MLTHLYKELNTPLDPIPTQLEAKLSKLEDIRAVIFDIYGTLVVSGTGDISIAQTIDKESELRALVEGMGYRIDPSLRLTDRFYELIREDHNQSKANGANYPEVDILEIWAQFFENLQIEGHIESPPTDPAIQEMAVRFECVVNPVWPMPELEALLETLRAANYALGIVSNAQFYTPLMLEGFTEKRLIQLGFQENLSVWSFKERLGKPSVELFEKLNRGLANQGIQPHQTVYVGNDMLNDIWTADQAGLKTALFAGDERSLRLRKNDERCKDLIPDLILTKLSQLADLL